MTAPYDDDMLEQQWRLVLSRAGELLPYFNDVRLSVSATQVAHLLGLPNADAVRRLLLKRRLPPFRMLRDWYDLSVMVERAEADDLPAHWAMQRGDFANVYYSFVSRLTGRPWRVVCKLGMRWVKARALAAWTPYLDVPGAGM